MLQQLSPDERLQLLRFVCSFAWADLEVSAEERVHIRRAVEKLDLQDEELSQVQTWLDLPPDPDSIDPAEVPTEHRQVFLRAIEGIILADERITQEELENLVLFKKLV